MDLCRSLNLRQVALAFECGVRNAYRNLHYGQPLVGLISRASGLSAENTGLIVTLPLAGNQ
jgi:hypothetical protein